MCQTELSLHHTWPEIMLSLFCCLVCNSWSGIICHIIKVVNFINDKLDSEVCFVWEQMNSNYLKFMIQHKMSKLLVTTPVLRGCAIALVFSSSHLRGACVRHNQHISHPKQPKLKEQLELLKMPASRSSTTRIPACRERERFYFSGFRGNILNSMIKV